MFKIFFAKLAIRNDLSKYSNAFLYPAALRVPERIPERILKQIMEQVGKLIVL